MLNMGGFKESVVRAGMWAVAKTKEEKATVARWKKKNFPTKAWLPSTDLERGLMRRWLAREHRKGPGQHRAVAFHPNFQSQGFGKWADGLGDKGSWKWAHVEQVAQEVRGAKSWASALDSLKTLSNVGEYTAAQGLCGLYFGVYGGNEGLFVDHHVAVDESMLDCTDAGPGPKRVMGTQREKKGGKKGPREVMFPELGPGGDVDTGGKTRTQAGFSKLVAGQVQGLRELGLLDTFPFLQEKRAGMQRAAGEGKGVGKGRKGGKGKKRGGGGEGVRLMSTVDFEHSLCYFHRYLQSMKTLTEEGAKAMYDRFHAPGEGIRKQSIKTFEGKKLEGVDAYCDKLVRKENDD